MADLTTRAGKGSPLTNAEVDANFTNLNTDKVETGLAALDAYDTTISDTAVDVFVYDTSRDSDGGAWRHRTQHTSWYNETLNTATRGSRREFPAVAVIVAEATQVTIYDGDDPSLPMWMVFNVGADASNETLLRYAAVEKVSALNAKMAVVAEVNRGLVVIDFIDETNSYYGTGGLRSFVENASTLANRNDTYIEPTVINSALAIVDNDVNDVAMTVLPNAPIDAATGLPVPTIAVATAAGVSVIKDDGTVVDSSRTDSFSNISFTEDYSLLFNKTTSTWNICFVDNYSADGFSTTLITASNFFSGNTSIAAVVNSATGSNDTTRFPGLALFSRLSGVSSLEEVAKITSTYNTGWMNGDIKLATLSDTDDTDVTGSELVTNGTFDTDSDWNKGVGWTISGGVASATSVANNVDFSQTSISGITAGKRYVLAGVASNYSSGALSVVIGNTSYGNIVTSNGVFSLTFVYDGNNPRVIFKAVSTTTVDLDNVSIREAEPDRSVNGNGLAVYGTITKDPVATGADLVAYSGFSASNYLEQPYNSDLDFGTGDFCVMGWVKTSSAGIDRVFVRDSVPTAQNFSLYVDASGKAAFLCDDDTTVRQAVSSGSVNSGTWRHLCGVYDGAGGVFIYVDGILAGSATGSSLLTLDNASATLIIGNQSTGTLPFAGSLALIRISATVPTAEQVAKIYNDEKFLFQENAQATLYGSSDAVTALAHDEVTDLLHVGTSAGRSVFQGLRRVDNTTDAVGVAISAYDGLVAED